MYTRAHRVAIECFRLLIRARGYTDLDELGFIMILRIIICDECDAEGGLRRSNFEFHRKRAFNI